MNKYTISKPIWDGGYKERCIGIAEFRLPCVVDISYTDKHDNLVYPDKYLVTREFAQKFDKKKVGANVELRVIPVSKLEKYEEPKDKKDKEIDELAAMLSRALECLDEIITTQASSAKYRKMARDAIQKILKDKNNE